LRRAAARPADDARAQEIARQSITVVKNEREILPLHAEDDLRILNLVLSSDWFNSQIGAGGGEAEAGLRSRGAEVATRRLGPEISPEVGQKIVEDAKRFSHVVVSAFVRVTSSKGTAEMDPSHAALLESLAAAGVKLVVVSYGSPYLLRQFPHVPAYLCAYSSE